MSVMTDKDFSPGFRLSKLDVFIVFAGIIGSYALYSLAPPMSYIMLFIVVHFFIFCNVLRMSRKPELIWASAFVLMCAFSLRTELISLQWVFVLSLALTLLLIGLELKKGSYHGVFWRRFNPKLENWFRENRSLKKPKPRIL